MIKIYDNIKEEKERIEKCIQKYGWTSDHNLDWFLECAINEEGRPVFVEFEDGTGLLTYKYINEWSVWSSPLAPKELVPKRIIEFSDFALDGLIREVWLVDVSDSIRSELENSNLKIGDIYYSLSWPVLDMEKYDPSLPGGHFKDIRNAKSKFYREHKVEIRNITQLNKEGLYKIVDDWKKIVSKRPDIYEEKYKKAISNNFKGFKTVRALVVDGITVGFNAGYEVVNHPGRFAGVVGIHDYSIRDLGLILWLEDLDWIKNAGYKELDMQGSEDDGGLKFKMQFNPTIERKTDTFCITRK